MNKIGQWDEKVHGPLDVEAVRALYQPIHHFRVYEDRYETHTPFASLGVARTYFVLAGRMVISDGTSTYTLATGQYISLSGGSYTIAYPETVEHIRVYELPETVWAHEKELYASTFRPRLQKIDHRLAAHRSEPGPTSIA